MIAHSCWSTFAGAENVQTCT